MPELKPRHASAALARIPKHNHKHQSNMPDKTFAFLQDGQEPWIGVITCADSRVPLESIIGDASNLGKAFKCACAGNTAKGAIGSLEFAVHHLGVKLLAVQGHTECGAVGAALSDYSGLSETLRGEIHHIKGMIDETPEDERLNNLDGVTAGVLTNIRAQVKALSAHFATEIERDGVAVVGLLYDLHNKFGGGFGKEYLYCIGDEIQTDQLLNHPLLSETPQEEQLSFILPLDL
ncbi:MAG: carbonic anhydrase [Pseudomonadota bacterium]|nr:carbonic anhydrase [Pseudomonadota bacterium]